MRPLVILIAVIAVFALIEKGVRSSLSPHPAPRAQPASASAAADAPKVVMYTTQSCGYCAQAREYFSDRGVSVSERDIERDADAANEFASLRGVGTPLILVGDERFDGFDEDALDDALDRAGI